MLGREAVKGGEDGLLVVVEYGLFPSYLSQYISLTLLDALFCELSDIVVARVVDLQHCAGPTMVVVVVVVDEALPTYSLPFAPHDPHRLPTAPQAPSLLLLLQSASLRLARDTPPNSLHPPLPPILPPQTAIQIRSVRAPNRIRNVQPECPLIHSTRRVQPKEDCGCQGNNVDEREAKVA